MSLDGRGKGRGDEAAPSQDAIPHAVLGVQVLQLLRLGLHAATGVCKVERSAAKSLNSRRTGVESRLRATGGFGRNCTLTERKKLRGEPSMPPDSSAKFATTTNKPEVTTEAETGRAAQEQWQ